MKYYCNKSGQSLVELLLAMALAAILLPALLTSLVASREGRAQQKQRVEAMTLLRESEEAIRNVRENGWTTFAINGTFYPVISGSNWSLASGSATINSTFIQQVVISDVYRDSNGAIVSSGGTIDPSSKKVITTVSWSEPHTSAVSSTLYITRYLDNLTDGDTTEAQFDQGTNASTDTVNNSGGEVVLGTGGHGGNWCEPNLSITALDLPKNGVANAVTAIAYSATSTGRVFAGTGDNASGVSFGNVSITNDYPPVSSLLGTFDCCKTNGIFGEVSYAYLATDNNSKEIEIVNIANTPYSEAGYFNAPGNGNGNAVFVVGTTGYMTSGNKLYTFDLSSKSGDRGNELGNFTLAGTGNKLYVVGGYVYVAVQSTSKQLQIINATNPSDLSEAAWAQVTGQTGVDVYVNETGTRAYLATAVSASQREFFIIDTSTKSGSRPTRGSFDTNGMNPKGVTVVTGNRAIIVGTGGTEYQVINISTETSPVACGPGLNIDTGVNGVASVLEEDGDAFSYIITGDSSSELKIIAGGGGGTQYTASGTFTSRTFDVTFQTAFNRFDVTFAEPSQTDIKFQLAVADAVSNSCNSVTFNFVGPDKTSSTFFEDDGAIPLQDDGSGYENPGRCFQYKAFFTTSDSSQTPVLYDMTANYSP